MSRTIKVKVPYITRLEGEASLELNARGDKVEKLLLRIVEPPRFFERLLVGKSYLEAPELSARICGICPMAYQLTSILAFEKLFAVDVPFQVAQLRRVMNLAEWIQSHALHIHFLALPDYLGYSNGLEMGRENGELFSRGIQIQGFGNQIMSVLGGRSVHPIGLRVGGFEKLPGQTALSDLRQKASEIKQLARQLVCYCSALSRPEYDHTFDYVSLKSDTEYPINSGWIASASDLNIEAEEYPDYFKEHQEPHSTALYSTLNGQDYLVGPLARFNNNYHLLDGETQELAVQAGLNGECLNMFDSILVRALEIHYACYEIERILAGYKPPRQSCVGVTPKAGTCSHATEAPRGLIFHQYELDDKGVIKQCTIIPPTSQNQARIEKDLKQSVEEYGLSHTDEELTAFCEQVIRNYDPCISCSTHFLKVNVKRA